MLTSVITFFFLVISAILLPIVDYGFGYGGMVAYWVIFYVCIIVVAPILFGRIDARYN